jgi:hypothetical protein
MVVAKYFILSAALLLSAICAAAQPDEGAAAWPQAALGLPEAGKGDLLGLIINAAVAPQYKQLIVPELYGEVRSGRIEMDAVRQLRYEWRMEEAWQRAEPAPSKLLTDRGALQAVTRLDRGFLFGARDVLVDEGDPRRLAQKVLWNIHSNFWSEKLMSMDFVLRLVAEAKVGRELMGRLSRVYPSSLIPNDATSQLFREIVKLNTPEMLEYYSWLTFRFVGDDEDVVYVYSPAVKRVRQVTGSNRSDAIANSVVSADDFLVWSGKPDSVDPVLTGRQVALVPFVSVVLGAARPESERCVVVDDTSSADSLKSTLARWNLGSARFPQAAAWVPTEVVFVPRELWRIELTPNDPYSLYGRQVVYVDAESMLPVYKFVSDQAGIRWKTVIGVIGLAEARDRKRYPFFSMMAVHDAKTQQGALVDYLNVKYCSNFAADLQLGEFQPGKLGPPRPDAAKGASKEEAGGKKSANPAK